MWERITDLCSVIEESGTFKLYNDRNLIDIACTCHMWRPVEVELSIDKLATLKFHCRKLDTSVVAGLTELPVVSLWIDNLCIWVEILVTTSVELFHKHCEATVGLEVRSLGT